MTPGSYFLFVLIAIPFAFWPEESTEVFAVVGLGIQIYYVNYRMKWLAWRLHRHLTKFCRESGFPAPGPFQFVDVWDRED
tara:strand:- start:315 stop:554 length:240 start_codon:yes stop_codon:yes gene_type:complete